ncbi:NHL repeat-containing protein [Tenacibaculum crassostreae]|uniref:hypothetical protein n=1 Tax=Tenacibaculum crassostreae TaxID=502683 RepID=UPI0038951095
MKKCLLIAFAAIQLVSCSKDDAIKEPIKDEILKGNVTSIGNQPSNKPVSNKNTPTVIDVFSRVTDIAIDQNGDLYVADGNDKRIKKIRTSNGSNLVTNFAGSGSSGHADGTTTTAGFTFPKSLVFSKDYKTLYVSTWYYVRAINMETNEVTTIAGGGNSVDGIGTQASFTSNPFSLIINNAGTALYLTENIIQIGSAHIKRVRRIDLATKEVKSIGFNNLTSTFNPGYMVVDSKDKYLYMANRTMVLKIELSTGKATTIAGNDSSGFVDGVGTAARFQAIGGLALSPNETYLYIANGSGEGVRCIRALNLDTKEVTTVTGYDENNNNIGLFADGDSKTARFNDVYGMEYDKTTNTLYAADPFNKAVRVIK